MKEFELSFNNKYVKAFIIWLVPLLLLSAVLIILLPTTIQVGSNAFFWSWVMFDRRK
ncbi:membrane protein CcdC involved in cytochrome C biogenesis [Alkalibacillus flavidus]|uniref:Membrane protein CcdC involved in cytochrome C biogenesis n=1 Tax=Alkalibacillus flavidus TaxID=546021 RepID=A0ABV2KVS1_9BACI